MRGKIRHRNLLNRFALPHLREDRKEITIGLLLSFISISLLLFFFYIVDLCLSRYYRIGLITDNITQVESGHLYYILRSDRTAPVKPLTDNYFVLPDKLPSEYRIIILGESAAQGYPCPPELSFAHFLERKLAKLFPNLTIKVINLAYFAQVSGFSRIIMKEARALQPDLVIYYGGHNEFYSQNLAATEKLMQYSWLRKITADIKSNSILFAYLSSYFDSPIAVPRSQLPEKEWIKKLDIGLANFKINLHEIMNQARSIGAKLLVSIPLRNYFFYPGDEIGLGVYPPDHGSPSTADNFFKMAQIEYKDGKIETATKYFKMASDSSNRIGRLRSSVEGFLRLLPQQEPDVEIFDAEQEIANRLNEKIIADSHFFDWVHLTPETSALLSDLLANKLYPMILSHFQERGIQLEVQNSSSMYRSSNLLENEITLYRDWCLEEAGYTNFEFGRFDHAILFFSSRSDKNSSLKSDIGLFLSQLQLGISQEAVTTRSKIAKNFSTEEIKTTLEKYYKSISLEEKQLLLPRVQQ